MYATRLLFLATLFCTSVFAKNKPVSAPDFAGITTNNKKVHLSDFKDKVVLIDFWASWCVPCRKEFPFLIDLYNQNQEKGFVVLAVNLDEYPANMRKFLQKLPSYVSFPVLIDDKGKIPTLYDIQAMPTTVLVDKTGHVRFVHKGFKESYKKEYLQEVKALLSEAPNHTSSLPKRE